MRTLARWLAPAAVVGMFLVLVMGATVTNTGSAEGCGRSWPLCKGELVPEMAVATLIEFSHRAVTGVVGFLIAALAIATWIGWRGSRAARVLVLLMVGALVLQAGMGAWAVLYPQTPAVLATHFGISLVCFASTVLVAAIVREGEAPRPVPPQPFRRAVWGIAAYSLVVVYLGAFVRHTNAQLACIDWPLCNGAVVPDLGGPAAVVFVHRVAALVLLFALLALALWSGRVAVPDLRNAAWLALGLGTLQALAGALVVFTRLSLFSALAHAGLMALLFATLGYLCLGTLRYTDKYQVVLTEETHAREPRRGHRPRAAHAPPPAP